MTSAQFDLKRLGSARPIKGRNSTGFLKEDRMEALIASRLASTRFFSHFERFLQRPQLGTAFDNPTAYTLPVLALTTLTDPGATADSVRDELTALWEAELETYINTTLDGDLETFLNTTLTAYITQAYQANKNLELLGTNADNAGVTFLEGGGIRLETAGADADQHIVGAHLETTMSALAGINWDSRNQPMIVAEIVTGPQTADLDNMAAIAGFKLTAVDLDTTDADQFMWRALGLGAGTPGTWTAVSSVAGVDQTHDTGHTLVEATPYQLAVVLDASRVPHYYLNGQLQHIGPVIAADNDYEFYVGIATRNTDAAAAVQLDIRNIFVSQLYG